ncbi:MAG: DUF4252 domain-containing protein [Chitinophagales bacterium]|nr:DUF4252 domain-containing protein [Bacteroidota bacterium]
MKKFTAIIASAAFILISSTSFAGNGNNNDSTNTADDASSTKLNLWIPGIFMKMAAGIAEEHVDGQDAAAVDLLRKFGNTTICIREGEYYKEKTDKKVTRKMNRMERKNYEALVSINSEGEKVNISIKENKRGKIRRMVVLVDEQDESFVFIKLNCRLEMQDIAEVCNNYIAE